MHNTVRHLTGHDPMAKRLEIKRAAAGGEVRLQEHLHRLQRHLTAFQMGSNGFKMILLEVSEVSPSGKEGLSSGAEVPTFKSWGSSTSSLIPRSVRNSRKEKGRTEEEKNVFHRKRVLKVLKDSKEIFFEHFCVCSQVSASLLLGEAVSRASFGNAVAGARLADVR